MAGKVELISKKRPEGSVFDESESPKRSKNTQRTQKFVLSTFKGLTTVFGMRTGGSP